MEFKENAGAEKQIRRGAIRLILQYMDGINGKTTFIFSIALVFLVLFIDFITRNNFQLQLLYVFPIGMAAWKNEKALALTISIIMPLARFFFDFPWHTIEPPWIAFINALIKIMVMIAFVDLIDRTVKHTKRLQKTIIKNANELNQLRAFARNTGTTLRGRGLSPGMAEGVALIYNSPEFTFEHNGIKADGIEIEINRIDRALVEAIEEMEATQKNIADDFLIAENALLEVHIAILKDFGFWGKCKQRVRENLVSAEQAVVEEITQLAAMMKEVKQEYLRERSADIQDIGYLILRKIKNTGERNYPMFLSPNTVLIAKELLPSDLMQVDRTNLAAFITEHNSPSSHVAILARSRNIPVISDIKDVTSLLVSGDRLLIDAEAGTVTVEPTKSQTDRFSVLKNQFILPDRNKPYGPALASTTKDGVSINLFANISRTDEAHLANEYQMDGVGLFRSEFLFLDVLDPPNIDAQCAMYSAVAKALNPRMVVIRTMDLGGDKIPLFGRAENVLALRMGKRGLAFSLTEKAMFRVQANAILRAAQVNDNIRIMFPMVMSVKELREACAAIDEIFELEQCSRRPLIGAMIETPAAVFDIHEIVKTVDFISIGTNDLSHFILALDRQSQYSDGVLSFLHPSVLRATEQIIGAALNNGKSVTVCGEAAGNPVTACLLLGMGVRNLSINPFQASRIRYVFQRLTINQMEAAAKEALIAGTSEDIKRIVTSIIRKAEESFK